MRERRGWRGVGVVVGRHVNRLHGRNRSLFGRRDPLLHLAHLAEQRRLIADRGRHAAEQRGHFGTGLREPEDIVDEQQHVLAFGVAEVLRDRQRRQADPQTSARRLRHLSVDQRRARFCVVLRIDDTALLELVPEVVAFARAFTHAAEHRDTAVLERDVVNQLHDDDGLADARAAEQSDLPALQVRLEEIDDLDARLEHLQVGRLILERGRRAVNRPAFLRLDRSIGKVDRFAEHVQYTAEGLRSHGHGDRPAEIDGFHAALQPVGRLHRDRAHAVLAEVLLDFGDDVDGCRT